MKIRGSKAVVTGAASGIGRATAIEMARQGACLFLTDINQAGLRETCFRIEAQGGKIGLTKVLDISDYDQVRSFADDVFAKTGAIDILVNVAGIALFAQLEDMSHSDWTKVMDVNLWGVIHGIECFVPAMIQAGIHGHVVSVSSTAGLIGLPWHAVYSGTKHAVVGISEVLRYDLEKHHIGIRVICPGAVATEMVQSVDIRAEARNIDKARQQFMKLTISPEKVAQLIINAIEKEKFLIITSRDIKLLYFLKQKMYPVYHRIMRLLTRHLDKALLSERP